MPFASDRFDTVVTTFTFCSVADQAAVLAEIRRVLKPGGTRCSWSMAARPTRVSLNGSGVSSRFGSGSAAIAT